MMEGHANIDKTGQYQNLSDLVDFSLKPNFDEMQ